MKNHKESISKEKNGSVKILEIIKNLSLGEILSLAVIYGLVLFIFPYFVYYKFLPIDMSIETLPIKFLFLIGVVVIGLSLIMTLLFTGVALFFWSFAISEEERGSSKVIDKNRQKIFCASGLYLLILLVVSGLLFSEKISELYVAILALIALVIVELFCFHNGKNKISKISSKFSVFSNTNAQKEKKFFFMILVCLIKNIWSQSFVSSFIRIFSAFIIFISSIYMLIILLVLSGFKFWISFVFLITSIIYVFFIGIGLYYREYISAIILLFLFPIILLFFDFQTYIKFLEISYSFLGITSNKNIVCIHKTYPLIDFIDKEKEIKYSCNKDKKCNLYYNDNDKGINLRLEIYSENFHKFRCFKDLNIIWDGNKNIWLERTLKTSNLSKENSKKYFIVTIPKSYLLNNDIINFGYTVKKEKQTEKNTNSYTNSHKKNNKLSFIKQNAKKLKQTVRNNSYL